MHSKMINIKKGLDVPMAGAPDARGVPNVATQQTAHVALLGGDYQGLRPAMAVQEGDHVKCGSLLFTDKQNAAARYTAPVAGRVVAINRGHRRALLSVVVERSAKQEHATINRLPSLRAAGIQKLKPQTIADALIETGLWCALRTRPFSKTPPTLTADTGPKALFVNVMDTSPLALSPQVFLEGHAEMLTTGLRVLSQLVACPIYVCHGQDISPPPDDIPRVEYHAFGGKHPAGLAGTHMHFLAPVGRGRANWWINYQDVAAIGYLFTEGRLVSERYIALAGPQVKNPRPLSVCQGSSLDELLEGELKDGETRVISGSVLQGHIAEEACAFLGRYHLQVSVTRPGTEREFMGWLSPGFNKFSALNIYISKLFRNKKFNLTTTTNGSERAMVPIGVYETVMPLDILPTQLLRALIVGDIEMAEDLGCLELDEEDLALCTFVCPGKYEYGSLLRHNLTRIEKENWDL